MIGQARVLDTRRTPEGLKRRRYELPDGRRVVTVELPLTVVRAIGMTKIRQHLDAWQRGEELRARGALIDQRIREGVKPEAIAHEFGVTSAAVRMRRQRMREGGDLAA